MQQLRSSPQVMTGMSSIRHSPSVTISSPGIRHSPSVSSPVPRSSPSVSSLSSVLRASPSILNQVSRSSSPAMQASSAGLNVTLGSTTPSFSPLTSGHQTSSSSASPSNYGWNYSQTLSYTQPTYASTNPFLTGAYMSYTPGDKFNTIGSTKEVKSFFESYAASVGETSKYSILGSKPTSYDTDSLFSSSDVGKYPEKTSYLSTAYSSELKYSPAKNNNYDVSPNVTQSISSSVSGLLNVEDTPTPTSSIETEDSNTREVGEKDVEGDGEQSD